MARTEHSRLAAFFTPKIRGKHEIKRKGLVLDVGFMRPLLVWRGYWIDEGYVMSGFKGTPGSWGIDKYGRVIDVGGMTIAARGIANPMVADPESLANSKLVSAAPELL